MSTRRWVRWTVGLGGNRMLEDENGNRRAGATLLVSRSGPH